MSLFLKSILTGAVVSTLAFWYLSSQKKNNIVIYNADYIVDVKPLSPDASLHTIVEIIDKRIKDRGYEHTIKPSGETAMAISIKGLPDTNFISTLLAANGKLQFRELYDLNELAPLLAKANELFIKKMAAAPPAEKKVVKRDSMDKSVSDLLDSMELSTEKEKPVYNIVEFMQPYQSTEGETILPSAIATVHIKDTAVAREIMESDKVRELTPDDVQYVYGVPEKSPKKVKRADETVALYAIRTNGQPEKALIENEDILSAQADFNQMAQPEVYIRFTQKGATKWAYLTKKNIGRSIAMVFNGAVVSAPTVLSEIEGGAASISGSYTADEVRQIAAMLKASPLPATLTVTSSVIKAEKSPYRLKKCYW